MLGGGGQQATQGGGTTGYAQRSWQYAFSIQTAIDTGLHGLPDFGEIGMNLVAAVQCQLIFHHQARQRQAGFATVRQQIFGGVERPGHRDLIQCRLTEVLFIHNEPTAHGVVGFRQDQQVARKCQQAQAIFMQ